MPPLQWEPTSLVEKEGGQLNKELRAVTHLCTTVTKLNANAHIEYLSEGATLDPAVATLILGTSRFGRSTLMTSYQITLVRNLVVPSRRTCRPTIEVTSTRVDLFTSWATNQENTYTLPPLVAPLMTVWRWETMVQGREQNHRNVMALRNSIVVLSGTEMKEKKAIAFGNQFSFALRKSQRTQGFIRLFKEHQTP